ncbi:MAG: hypothetical protein P8X79_03925 [Reinekea sp.]
MACALRCYGVTDSGFAIPVFYDCALIELTNAKDIFWTNYCFLISTARYLMAMSDCQKKPALHCPSWID